MSHYVLKMDLVKCFHFQGNFLVSRKSRVFKEGIKEISRRIFKEIEVFLGNYKETMTQGNLRKSLSSIKEMRFDKVEALILQQLFLALDDRAQDECLRE